MPNNTVLLSAIALIYAVIAIPCMMWPERLEVYALGRVAKDGGRHSFATWLVGSPNYSLWVQAVGAISASAAVAITLFLLEQAKHFS
jgi:hypothetical protein